MSKLSYFVGNLSSRGAKGEAKHQAKKKIAVKMSSSGCLAKAEKGEKQYTGKKGEYTKNQQGNFMKVHPLDRK